MVRVVQAGSLRRMAAMLLSLLTCVDAAAVCDDRSRPGCNGSGESEKWLVEHVDRTFRMRATNKIDGSSTAWRIAAGAFGGDVRAIQVYRSRALVISYVTRGIYHIVLLDLAGPGQVASFLAYDLRRSPDDRYLLYRIAYNAWSPGDARVMLLDLQSVDDGALLAGRADCDIMAPCASEVGNTAYELPSEGAWLGAGTWDLEHSRLLLTVPEGDGRSSLVAVSLTGDTPEVACRVPIHEMQVQSEFPASFRRGVRALTYESADDVAVIDVEDQNSVKSEYRVSLAEACVDQGTR